MTTLDTALPAAAPLPDRITLPVTTTARIAGRLGTILAVWAHPDDETYLAGGLMAAAVEAGHRVVCVSMTAGEHGTDDPANWPPARLGAIRRREAAAAMAELGVREHSILDLPDGGLDAVAHDDGVALAGRLIDAVGPDTIVTFGPDGATFHPDHLAVHRWTTEAWRRRGGARLLHSVTTTDHLARFGDALEDLGVYMDDRRPVGVAEEDLSVHIRLDGHELDRKMSALRAMPSQTSAVLSAVGPELLAAEVAEECFVDADAV